MKRSQCAAILAHLERGRILTPLDALGRYGVFRLAARIADLRNAGHPVQSRMVKVGSKTVAAYWIE